MTFYADYGYNHSLWGSAYDSTWEEDEEDGEPKCKKVKTFHQDNRLGRAARDLQNYRHGYPDDSYKPNLQFYQNKMPFKPNGEYIDTMHDSWRNDYYTLETNHNFIQWLFPLREPGVNRQATPLTLSEIQMMKMDKQVMKRLLESYKLMLGFYGLVLLDEDTGEVARAENNWEDRFNNLNYHTHNNLRITRILKCLGEMGYEKLQAPLVKLFLEETLCNGNLPNVKTSALDYFMFTVKDKKERQRLVHFAWMHYTPQDRFSWGPVEILKNFNPTPKKAELICEVEIVEEPQVNIITSKSDSSGGYCAVDIEAAGEEPERKREGICCLVRTALGYIVTPFRLLSRSFLVFFRWLYRSLRRSFTGCFFWFRGEKRNQDSFNEEPSVRTEDTKTENSLLLYSAEHKESHKAEVKELDGQTDNSIEKSEPGANLETEDNGSKYESVPEDDAKSEDGKPLVLNRLPISSEDDNGAEDDTESEDGKPLVLNRLEISSEDDNGAEDDTESEDGKPLVLNRLEISSEDDNGAEDDTESEDGKPLVLNRLPVSSEDDNGSEDDTESEDGKPLVLNRLPISSEDDNGAEDDTESEDGKPLVLNRLAISREDDNGAEDEDNSGNFTKYNQRENVTKLDKDPISGNERFTDKENYYSEEGNNSDEHTMESRIDNSGGDATHFGAMIANAGVQFGETKIWVGETEVEGASNVELDQLCHGDRDVTEDA